MEEVISRAKACGEGEDGERCEKVRGALPPGLLRALALYFEDGAMETGGMPLRLKASCASTTSPSACP